MLCGRDGVGLSKKEQKELRLTEEEYALAVHATSCAWIFSAPARQSHHLLWGRGRPDRLPGSLLPPPLPWGKEDKELQDYVASRLNHRKGSALLKYGYCEVTAEDPDTLRVARYLNGTDGLGTKPASSGKRLCSPGSCDF